MKRCPECGTPTRDGFCSDECFDLWANGAGIQQVNSAGESILVICDTGNIRRDGGRGPAKKYAGPITPSRPVEYMETDLNDLPF